MNPSSPKDGSPIAIVKREVHSKYPNLESGFTVASLDPEPIQARDREIDAIWRDSVRHFKMYLNDAVIPLDKIHLHFNTSTPQPALNTVRAAIFKRLEFDGIKSGSIRMQVTSQNQTMEVSTPGFAATAAAFQKEIFTLIAVVRPPDFAAPPPPKK